MNNSQSHWSELKPEIFVIIALALSIISNFLFEFINWWFFLFDVLLVALAAVGITVYNNIVKVKSINTEITRLEGTIDRLNQSSELEKPINRLGELISKITASELLSKYVCDENTLTKIEGSVGDCPFDNAKIYVQSSKFQLETTESAFAQMLYENLRKGVVYYYLIPRYRDNPLRYDSFINMVVSWWKEYSCFLSDQEKCRYLYSRKKSTWQKKYIKCIEKASELWRKDGTNKDEWSSLYDKVFALFQERLSVFVAEESTFYLVTAVYQVGNNKWKAIIKLPTDYTDDDSSDYYSFVVFGNESRPFDNEFIKKFTGNFNQSSKYDMQEIFKQIKEDIGEVLDGKINRN